MPITIAVGRERTEGERRVALVPETAKKFAALGVDVRVEQGAGLSSNFLDSDYANVTVAGSQGETYQNAQIMMRVTPPSLEEIEQMPQGAVLIGLLKPYESKERLAALNARQITAFALELLPRISRAQSMDALSSQGACSGYQCALIGASHSAKFFPMLTTAAGRSDSPSTPSVNF